MMFRPGFAVAPGGGGKIRAGVAPLSGEVSRMIGIARVVCIFTVIYAHTYVGMAESLTDDAAGVVAISAIKMFLSDGLARVGVPLLGLFSGMLALDTLRRASYGRVLRRKVRSLIVPMMAWSMIFLAVTVGIGLLSGDLAFLRKEVPSGLEAWVNAMLSLTAYPYNGPLHYLRDIFVCFLLLPVILAALQKVPRTTVILAIMVFVWGDALADALGDVAVPLFLRPGVPALFTVGLALRQGVIRLPRRMWSHVLLPSGVALALLVLIPAALDPSGGQRDALATARPDGRGGVRLGGVRSLGQRAAGQHSVAVGALRLLRLLLSQDYAVPGEFRAWQGLPVAVPAHDCVRIFSGGPCPVFRRGRNGAEGRRGGCSGRGAMPRGRSRRRRSARWRSRGGPCAA